MGAGHRPGKYHLSIKLVGFSPSSIESGRIATMPPMGYKKTCVAGRQGGQ